VARQVDVDPDELAFYEWTGRTIEYHRAQIRTHLGFRECSVGDAEKLTEWLAVNVCEAERRPELVRDELLARCRAERIEPPTARRGLTPLFWTHGAPYGEVKLDMTSRLALRELPTP
jgi:hypothetical protein